MKGFFKFLIWVIVVIDSDYKFINTTQIPSDDRLWICCNGNACPLDARVHKWVSFDVNMNQCMDGAARSVNFDPNVGLVRYDADNYIDFIHWPLEAHDVTYIKLDNDWVPHVIRASKTLECGYIGVVHEEFRYTANVTDITALENGVRLIDSKRGTTRETKFDRDLWLLYNELHLSNFHKNRLVWDRYTEYVARTLASRYGTCSDESLSIWKALDTYGAYYIQGGCTRNVELLDKAHALEPMRWEPLYWMAFISLIAHDYDMCVALCKRAHPSGLKMAFDWRDDEIYSHKMEQLSIRCSLLASSPHGLITTRENTKCE